MTIQETLQEIATSLTLSNFELLHLMGKSPHTYKTYYIDKKSSGQRKISQPARETKHVQRLLIEKIFSNLPVHRCATAYHQGASIKHNATQHKKNEYISKFDFKDFFSSITENDIIKHLTKELPKETPIPLIRLISRASCISHKNPHSLTLSVGAPSSPILSNSIMFEFDNLIYEWCKKKDIIYTRYADDLTFSSNIKGISLEIERTITKTLKTIEYPTLDLNTKKTLHLSKKNQRRVTGLIINNDGNISLGRERKRLISAMIHHYSLGTLDTTEIPKLQGLLGFAEDAEPLFSSRMRQKYGTKLISEILQYRIK